MAKPTPVVFVGTKPARPHFLCDEVRFEHWGRPDGSTVPVLRMRNEQFGCMSTFSHESLSALHSAIGDALAKMEAGAAVQAKGVLDDIIAKAKQNPPQPEEGTSNE